MNERDILTEKKYAREEGHASGLQEGLAKGREEGREEGVKEGTTRIALNMKKAGIAISVIEQVTGLSSSQIDSL